MTYKEFIDSGNTSLWRDDTGEVVWYHQHTKTVAKVEEVESNTLGVYSGYVWMSNKYSNQEFITIDGIRGKVNAVLYQLDDCTLIFF